MNFYFLKKIKPQIINQYVKDTKDIEQQLVQIHQEN